MRTGALIVKNSDGFALFCAVSAGRWRRRDMASGRKRTSTNTASRLYQQERERPDGPSLPGVYVRRWVGRANGGVPDLKNPVLPPLSCAMGPVGGWLENSPFTTHYAETSQPQGQHAQGARFCYLCRRCDRQDAGDSIKREPKTDRA